MSGGASLGVLQYGVSLLQVLLLSGSLSHLDGNLGVVDQWAATNLNLCCFPGGSYAKAKCSNLGHRFLLLGSTKHLLC